MRPIFGAALVTATLAVGSVVTWRITRGVEAWFATSGAGNVLMWSVVVALILTAFALPAAAWGLAARAWVVKIRHGERLEAPYWALLCDTQNQPPQQDHYALSTPRGEIYEEN